MMKKASTWLLAGIGCLGSCGGWAGQSTEATDATDYFQRVATTLQVSDGERERALAAQLFAFEGKPARAAADANAQPVSANEALARQLIASVDQSNDAVALSFATQAAMALGDKASMAVSAGRWQAVEPDNLAPLLFSSMPIEEVLTAARRTTRHESHGYDQIRTMSDAFIRVPMSRQETGPDGWREYPTAELRAGVSAFAIWAAYVLPGLKPLSDACKNEALESTPARRADCLHVARTLATQSDTLLMTSLGIGILKRAANTAEDNALAITLGRNNAWQQQQYFQVLSTQRGSTQEMEATLRLLHSPGVESEAQLREATLRERGIALVPPSDWAAPDPG